MEYVLLKYVSLVSPGIFFAASLLKMVSERIDLISDLSLGEAFIGVIMLIFISGMFAFLKHHESQVRTEK